MDNCNRLGLIDLLASYTKKENVFKSRSTRHVRETSNLVFTVFLGAIHRFVRGSIEFFWGIPVFGTAGNTDTT